MCNLFKEIRYSMLNSHIPHPKKGGGGGEGTAYVTVLRKGKRYHFMHKVIFSLSPTYLKIFLQYLFCCRCFWRKWYLGLHTGQICESESPSKWPNTLDNYFKVHTKMRWVRQHREKTGRVCITLPALANRCPAVTLWHNSIAK